MKVLKNAKTYEVCIAEVAPGGTTGPWQRAGFFSNSRAIPIKGMTLGVTYNV